MHYEDGPVVSHVDKQSLLYMECEIKGDDVNGKKYKSVIIKGLTSSSAIKVRIFDDGLSPLTSPQSESYKYTNSAVRQCYLTTKKSSLQSQARMIGLAPPKCIYWSRSFEDCVGGSNIGRRYLWKLAEMYWTSCQACTNVRTVSYSLNPFHKPQTFSECTEFSHLTVSPTPPRLESTRGRYHLLRWIKPHFGMCEKAVDSLFLSSSTSRNVSAVVKNTKATIVKVAHSNV